MAETPRRPSDTTDEAADKAEAQRTADEQHRADMQRQRAEAERANAQRTAAVQSRGATPPSTAQPLRCRCGSVAFGSPSVVALTKEGEKLTAHPAEAPDDLTYSCLGCGDTGTLEYLKGRLDG